MPTDYELRYEWFYLAGEDPANAGYYGALAARLAIQDRLPSWAWICGQQDYVDRIQKRAAALEAYDRDLARSLGSAYRFARERRAEQIAVDSVAACLRGQAIAVRSFVQTNVAALIEAKRYLRGELRTRLEDAEAVCQLQRWYLVNLADALDTVLTGPRALQTQIPLIPKGIDVSQAISAADCAHLVRLGRLVDQKGKHE